MQVFDEDFNLDNDNCSDENTIVVIGKGSVNVKADIVEILLGIINRNCKLQDAQEENLNITKQVTDCIQTLGVPLNNIQTMDYNIKTLYNSINGKNIFNGYEVIRDLVILVNDINDVGKIIDMSIENGANSLNGIIFSISNETKYYYEALRLAVEDAQEKAKVIAKELKVNLNIIPIKIIEKSESNSDSTESDLIIEAVDNIINADIEAIFRYKK